jgi:nucleoside-diphosphate-sugar epimerase
MTSKKTIAMVGGTGNLGRLIADALLAKPDVRVRMLVRPESRAKAADLEARGVELVEGGFGPDGEAALATLCTDAFTVVSALQGGPDVIVDAQRQLLSAARAQRVTCFIPSDYTFNMFKVREGENVASDIRWQFAEVAARERGSVEVVHVLNGAFLDRRVVFGFLGAIDLSRQSAVLWGDGEQPMDFTTYEDTARYTTEVAVDERSVPTVFSVAGDVLNFHELVQAYEAGSGKRLHVERRGSLADLDARIAQLQQAEPANLYAYLPLMYYRAMLSGRGKLDEVMNDRYPAVQPTRVREYVARERL